MKNTKLLPSGQCPECAEYSDGQYGDCGACGADKPQSIKNLHDELLGKNDEKNNLNQLVEQVNTLLGTSYFGEDFVLKVVSPRDPGVVGYQTLLYLFLDERGWVIDNASSADVPISKIVEAGPLLEQIREIRFKEAKDNGGM